MKNFLIVTLATIFLLSLIFNIKNSERFNIFDERLHRKLIRDHNGIGWQIIAFLNDPKLMVVWAVLLASTLIDSDHVITALWVLGTLGLTDLAGIILKKIIKRKRPKMASKLENGYSFPSGHVLGATTMMLILLRLFGAKLGLGFILFLVAVWVMVIISRLSLRAHYPSDVAGATSLAILCFAISQQVFQLL
ncbi:MAG: phosphatase PAP2 family protein [Candidatus Lactobacillus pullistercoris]|uniref:Phosphatase PAP2 family protein n=1 Tax=Candidatus Lactobacillus pullistercoris TaxID=2838636 RepID=A0A9E2KQM6_9LACO|nr:phosphatase PAP2 family protein [Candidatus Lactobacillus pullistercoris]